ncbi:MAG TPA: 2-polyprenyl-3-methyl-6-methoxy-1,4-benzoquinone monooxygenase [Steroidobacteraceae bacterium]|nr:2-polyprenyl-3-methyl-6-methoxy-1,4-benzoquinone monooxygenase [Steroidobacteraceae bacterium]
MDSRRYTPLDRLIGGIDKAINVLAVPAQAARSSPAAAGGEPPLSEAERRKSSRLMRVNHAGEVAAQALYQGQALTARDPAVAAAMRRAATEESDHLAWCEQRLAELGGAPSRLNPIWYLGSLAIGALAGAFGDRTSLGFIRETERQVETHLGGHLDRLPVADHRSRAILERMRDEESQHGRTAESLGGVDLPLPVRAAMHLVSRVMTRGSYLA